MGTGSLIAEQRTLVNKKWGKNKWTQPKLGHFLNVLVDQKGLVERYCFTELVKPQGGTGLVPSPRTKFLLSDTGRMILKEWQEGVEYPMWCPLPLCMAEYKAQARDDSSSCEGEGEDSDPECEDVRAFALELPTRTAPCCRGDRGAVVGSPTLSDIRTCGMLTSRCRVLVCDHDVVVSCDVAVRLSTDAR